MKILGLDLSLTSTGFSHNGEVFSYGIKQKGAERLSIISLFVLDYCKEKNIDCVVVEGYSFASRNSQAHSIGELGGCVRMRLWDSRIPYVDVPPTSRAKFATGKGNAGKAEVISAISSKTGIVFSGGGADDECDAWVLEQMGLQKIGLCKYAWTKEQLSSLEKIDWSPIEKLLEKK